MIRDESYRIDVFDSEEQDKVLSEDLCEIYTVFKYISSGLYYHSNCLRGLKILDIGCGSGENCSLALNHGAEFVAGIDLSASIIQSAQSNFSKANIDQSRYLFTKANIFSMQSVDMSLPLSSFENFFDRAMCCWVMSQAKSLSDIRELIGLNRRYVKPGGNIVILIVNPLIIANFPAVKQLPRVENFRLVEVAEEGDHFKLKSQILHPFSEEVLMEVNHNIFSIEQIKNIIHEVGLQVKHSGNLELTQRDESLSYPFEMISQELSKDTTLGYFLHLKKPS
jgi:SAM-dependent methyltransferase